MEDIFELQHNLSHARLEQLERVGQQKRGQ